MDHNHKLITLCVLILLMGCSAQAPPPADCDPDAGPCAKPAATLEITPRPVAAMRELTFSVITKGAPAPDMIDLSMPGMTMGVNRVPLKRVAPGTYAGQGVIVRCPSGATLWRAAVYNGDALVAEYLFDVRR